MLDGTIDVIATDHAPHSVEEKAGGLRKSLMGIVGLETAFPVLYTELVETGLLPLPLLIDKLALSPRRIFGLPGGAIAPGQPADLTVLDLNRSHRIDSSLFHSLGRATPFDGWQVTGKIAMTFCGGNLVYAEPTREENE